MPEIYGIRDGLNLDNLDVTTDDEINTFLTFARIGGHESVYGQRLVRGPLDPGPRYDMTANSIWLYTRPDVAKLHMRVLAGTRSLGINAGVLTASSSANMHTYINQGWEIGIENCMRGMQMRGFTRAQLMEVIMHAQMSAGIRGLELVSRAIGIILGGNPRALMQSVLLAKGWGVFNAIIVNTMSRVADYFWRPERMDMAAEVLADVL